MIDPDVLEWLNTPLPDADTERQLRMLGFGAALDRKILWQRMNGGS